MTVMMKAIAAFMIVLGFGAVFVVRMGRHDAHALADFTASYDAFDRRTSDDAFNDLRVKSAMQISSLQTNDGAMMRVAREVSAIAAEEVAAVRAYRAATPDVAPTLASRLSDIRQQRHAAFAHFQRLRTAPPNSD